MSKAALAYVNKKLSETGINYAFLKWKGEPVYPYWVGEYQESPPSQEDGSIETAFTITGWTNGEALDLENDKEKIEKAFTFCTTVLDNGSGIDISYNGAFIIPQESETFVRMQINLSIKEWRVI